MNKLLTLAVAGLFALSTGVCAAEAVKVSAKAKAKVTKKVSVKAAVKAPAKK